MVKQIETKQAAGEGINRTQAEHEKAAASNKSNPETREIKPTTDHEHGNRDNRIEPECKENSSNMNELNTIEATGEGINKNN